MMFWIINIAIIILDCAHASSMFHERSYNSASCNETYISEIWSTLCPEDAGCTCRKSQRIACEYSNGYIWRLDLSACNLNKLPDFDKYPAITLLSSLNLANNAIRTLKPFGFSGLKNLTHLNISGNLDTYDRFTIPNNSFSGLDSLQVLALQILREDCSNFVGDLEKSTFESLARTLIELHINGIEASMSAVSTLHRLKILNLGGVPCCELSSNTFKNFPYMSLERVSFRNCQTDNGLDLSRLLQSVIYLELSCTNIGTLSWAPYLTDRFRVLIADGLREGVQWNLVNTANYNLTALSYSYYYGSYNAPNTKPFSIDWTKASFPYLRWLSLSHNVINEGYKFIINSKVSNLTSLEYLDLSLITSNPAIRQPCTSSTHPWFFSPDMHLMTQNNMSSSLAQGKFSFLPNLRSYVATDNVYLPIEPNGSSDNLQAVDFSRLDSTNSIACSHGSGYNSVTNLTCRNCKLGGSASLVCLTKIFPKLKAIDLESSTILANESLSDNSEVEDLNLRGVESNNKSFFYNLAAKFPRLKKVHIDCKLPDFSLELPTSLTYLNLAGSCLENLSNPLQNNLDKHHLNQPNFKFDPMYGSFVCSCDVLSYLVWLNRAEYVIRKPYCNGTQSIQNWLESNVCTTESSSSALTTGLTASCAAVAVILITAFVVKRYYWKIKIRIYRAYSHFKTVKGYTDISDSVTGTLYLSFCPTNPQQYNLIENIHSLEDTLPSKNQILSRSKILLGEMTNLRIVEMILASQYVIVLVDGEDYFHCEESLFELHAAVELLNTDRVKMITRENTNIINLPDLISQILQNNSLNIYPNTTELQDANTFLKNLFISLEL